MCQMIKLKIKNFGPISNAELELSKYTVLIGDQGSGKSTIAKVFTLFTWLEKTLIRHQYSEKQLKKGKFAKKTFCAYHRISSYFKSDSFLKYEGLNYMFTYAEERLEIELLTEQRFDVAKVMYVPAERNLLSSIERPRLLKGLPDALTSFLEELESAKTKYTDFKLPLKSLSFQYDKLNDLSWIGDGSYRLRLSEASSGYQSLVPLCLVTSYLTEVVIDAAETDLSLEERMLLRKQIGEVMDKKELPDNVKSAFLETYFSKFSYASFMNVVEEMEQNLYPTSQKKVLFFLLEKCNDMPSNRLLLTTHSPYLINYLSLAAKGFQVRASIQEDKKMIERLHEIVPLGSLVNPDLLQVYEVNQDGTVRCLDKVEGVPSDENYLNNLLGDMNEVYNDLLDIEEECQI